MAAFVLGALVALGVAEFALLIPALLRAPMMSMRGKLMEIRGASLSRVEEAERISGRLRGTPAGERWEAELRRRRAQANLVSAALRE